MAPKHTHLIARWTQSTVFGSIVLPALQQTLNLGIDLDIHEKLHKINGVDDGLGRNPCAKEDTTTREK